MARRIKSGTVRIFPQYQRGYLYAKWNTLKREHNNRFNWPTWKSPKSHPLGTPKYWDVYRSSNRTYSLARYQQQKSKIWLATAAHVLKNANCLATDPIIPHEIPEVPGTEIGTDIFELHKKPMWSPLIKPPSFSTFTEYLILSSCLPNSSFYRLTSVNEFKIFANDWNFQRGTSSGLYPQSNSLVERNIQTVKCTLKKAMKINQNSFPTIFA